MIYQPSKVILTSGSGRAFKKLVSFEMALRDAKIARFNLIQVSSILPPNIVPSYNIEELELIQSGSIVPCVLSRCEFDNTSKEWEEGIISSAIGIAYDDKYVSENNYGFLSEFHKDWITEKECGIEAEEIAKEMLFTIKGDIEFRSMYISKGVEAQKGFWTTVVSAAILV